MVQYRSLGSVEEGAQALKNAIERELEHVDDMYLEVWDELIDKSLTNVS